MDILVASYCCWFWLLVLLPLGLDRACFLRLVAANRAITDPPFTTRARCFKTKVANNRGLDLNLSGNLDHIFGRQIESIDHL